MRRKIAAIAVVAGAMMCAWSMGLANAGGDAESCKSTTTNVTNTNIDGTECETVVSGPGPNKATAKASGLGFAFGKAANGATVSANAKGHSQALCEVAAGLGSSTSSGLGAVANVQIAPVGGGKAKATGPNSMAVSEISSPAGGNAVTTASGGGTAVSNVKSTDVGSANANAKLGSTAVSTVDMLGGGKASSSSTGAHADAVSTVEDDCRATSTAKGANSTAVATCHNSGTSVSAEATNGSTAVGSDTVAPTCTPVGGGKAKVRSPAGNCG